MNIVKKGLLILVSILVVNYSFDCLWFYLKPKYNGQLELKSIQETTTVYFDEYGFLISMQLMLRMPWWP
jgi:penicillin amidase